MARKRMLSPEIWESESFGSLSVLAKVLWIGLISLADDDGRGRCSPRLCKSKILPYDVCREADIDNALLEIGQKMSVTIYDVESVRYYQLDKWKKWQSIQKPKYSSIPAPLNDGVKDSILQKQQVREPYSTDTKLIQTEYGTEDRIRNKENGIKEDEDTREQSSAKSYHHQYINLITDVVPDIIVDCDISSIDVDKFVEELKLSAYLRKFKKLSQLVNIADKILSGNYRPFERVTVNQCKTVGHSARFEGERQYSKAELDKQFESMSNIDDLLK